jgi:isoleucyl-tRNA synthetase
MDAVREIASSASALRKARGLRVRLPLAGITLATDPLPLEYDAILKDELNVKGITHTDAATARRMYGIVDRLVVNARAAGPRLGKDVQRVIQAAKAGNWTREGADVVVDGTPLDPAEYELDLVADDESLAVAFLAGGGFIVLDTVVTPELEAEGLARDVVRAVQQARKDAGLDVGDRIALTLSGDTAAIAAIETHRDLIAGETLATSLESREAGTGDVPVGADSRISIGLERA